MIRLRSLVVLGMTLALAACGGGSSSDSGSSSTANFTIGGTVSGLNGALVLSANGSNALTVNGNGAFTFSNTIASNKAYSVTVATQPSGQVCTVTNGSGSGMVTNVSNIAVTCSASTYTIGGNVSGLASGQSVALQNNGDDAQTVSANGSFTFATPVAANSSYTITVASEPTGQVCTVSNASGSGVVANMTNVAVVCSTDPYTIGGTVAGLASGQQVTLLNNGADPQTVTANGGFAFAVPVVANSSYGVTVGTQPVGQTCTVSNASGAGVVANVNSITVNCSTSTYTISGTVNGLASGQQMTLYDNGSDALTINANGGFSFATPIAFNGSYAVTVGTLPTMQTCSVTNATGAGVVANISNVAVNCSTTTYTVSGTVFGLTGSQQVTILNNGANPMTLNGNGNFTFATPVVAGGAYQISVGTQPTTEFCTVTNGSGGPLKSNAYAVAVNCSPNTYQVGGAITGLNSGAQVTLDLNGTSPDTVTANGSFIYYIAYGGSYTVTVGTQPVGEACTVANGSGNNVINNVGNVTVSCAWTESVLYSFQGVSVNDGARPLSGLTQGTGGNFYGFTDSGGAHGDGVFYTISPSGSETVLYSFGASSSDGVMPQGTPVLGADGNFYGVTQDGGANNEGTIFKMTPSGSETVLYSFGASSNDGFLPGAGLVFGSDGNLYGTTQLGGGNHSGTVFSIATDGSGYTQMYSFNPSTNDADMSQAALIQGTDGDFYGTTINGGANGYGAVFKITTAGVETVLYSFTGSNGKYPTGALVQGTDGNFYGTTSKGGSNGVGVAYKITPGGMSVLYNFGNNDAQEPNGALVQAADGNFYGLSQYGGSNHDGALFKLTPAGVESVLWSFGSSGDGSLPYGVLLIGADGHFYGTTSIGGADGNGIVFKY